MSHTILLRTLASALVAAASFACFGSVSAAEFPFSDVPVSDPIHADLKRLYERGVIDAPSDGKFHPEALIDRDEFVSIVVGVSCRKCLTPTVDDILKYREAPFVDFDLKSRYFYCVSYAKEKEIVIGYSIPGASSFACQDGKSWDGVPFCEKNRTSRIEAAAMLLRQAGLWNDVLNGGAFEKRRTFKDVEGYWYGYAQKAVDVGIVWPDADGTVRPDEYITKREFVRMASMIYGMNMCDAKSGNGNGNGTGSPSGNGVGTGNGNGDGSGNGSTDAIASEIRVVDTGKNCGPSTPASALDNQKSYTICGQSSVTDGTYSWRFFPADGTGSVVTATGRTLPGFALPEGRWIAELTVTSPDGRTSVALGELPYGGDAAGNASPSGSGSASGSATPLSVTASATPLVVPTGMPVDFSSVVSGGKGPYSYRWDLGDGSVVNFSDPIHRYAEPGTYPVTLIVTDSEGNRAVAKVVIVANENPDYDGDGILNADDACPQVFWPASNSGCPPVGEYPRSGGDSGSGTSSTGFGTAATLTLGGVGWRCALSFAQPAGAVFGKVACSSCPCVFEADFRSQVRHCDLLFPAILSPDKKTVYGRGALYEVR